MTPPLLFEKVKIKALETQNSELTNQVAGLTPLQTQNDVLREQVLFVHVYSI
jgi:hypothetical protein